MQYSALTQSKTRTGKKKPQTNKCKYILKMTSLINLACVRACMLTNRTPGMPVLLSNLLMMRGKCARRKHVNMNDGARCVLSTRWKHYFLT